MNELKIFESPSFGQVRTVEENGKVLFCGADIAKALGYGNGPDALQRHCRAIVKRYTPISGKMQEINFIPEGDVYRLITHSKLPTAEQFERWVFDEVLPDIRRTGMYATPDTVDKLLADPDTAITLLTKYKEERERRKVLEAQAEQDKPKVLFADSVAASRHSILIGELAKLMRQNGIQIGQNRLFEELRRDGYLCKGGERYNLPTQRSMEAGWFELKETTINRPDGSILVSRTNKVTGRGQIYFINRYLGRKEA
jgi:prophage antirepressor-like protein